MRRAGASNVGRLPSAVDAQPRHHAPQIETELWKTRTLVKTSLMRQTLHLIPTDEFPLYIAALRPSRLAQAIASWRDVASHALRAKH